MSDEDDPQPGPGAGPPLWREELPIRRDEEQYISRRQFTKFLVLTSAAMFAGQLWMLLRSLWPRPFQTHAARRIALIGEIPVDGVRLFTYPTEADPCILVRTGEDEYHAYSQKCTHLSCAVYYSPRPRRLVCPCHTGYFSVHTGRVLQGPPPRPLPRIVLERRGREIWAVGVDPGAGHKA